MDIISAQVFGKAAELKPVWTLVGVIGELYRNFLAIVGANENPGAANYLGLSASVCQASRRFVRAKDVAC